MKKIIFTLLAISILTIASAQSKKCGIDTKALVAEKIAKGATNIDFLAKMQPGFDRDKLEKAGIKIGAQAGQIITMTVPVESLGILESNREVQQYSISHTIAAPMMDKTKTDTRTDSVNDGIGVTDGVKYDGNGVYIGITDWGFDYTHPNLSDSYNDPRIVRAWDHFRLAGPVPEGAPAGAAYGTEIIGKNALLAAHGDTSNLYGYGTHGTHVAGITAGKGRKRHYIGQAPAAQMLMCTFGLGEKPWMDGVAWMKRVAENDNKRLVINSSWGMYSFSTIDGTSLLSQAINSWADSGVVFVTSAGNNGGSNFHISKTFTNETVDTLRTIVAYSNWIANAIGQCLIMWGEEGHDYSSSFMMTAGGNQWKSPSFNTAGNDTVLYDTLLCDAIRIPYRVLIEHQNPFNNRPHMQFDINFNTNLQLHLFITAESGTVHAWNVANKTNHAGNEGEAFTRGNLPGYSAGNNYYGVSEPSCADKNISVAAHNADNWNSTHTIYTPGDLTYFSSKGPLINGNVKPEISAPGYEVVSSISVWASGSYGEVTSQDKDGRHYIWSKMSGTSMSGPAVTGVVALLLQANPTLTTDQVRDILFTTARNDTVTGQLVANDSMDYGWGWGKVDALDAINKAISMVSIKTAEDYRLPMHVYPNPASSTVTINTGCGEQQTMQVFSIDGRRIVQMPVTEKATINVSNWKNGVYIVRVGSRTEKFIVK